jgi:hypothetical protein
METIQAKAGGVMLALLCVCGCAQKPKPKATHPTLAVAPATTATLSNSPLTVGSGTVTGSGDPMPKWVKADPPDDEDCKVDDRTCDPVSQDVYDVMLRRFGGTSDYGRVVVWINSEYGNEYALHRYQGLLMQIKAIDTWADGLPPGRVRSAYLATAESYEQAIQESLNELRTHDYQHQMDEYRRKQKECEKATDAYRAKHKIPEPPQ